MEATNGRMGESLDVSDDKVKEGRMRWMRWKLDVNHGHTLDLIPLHFHLRLSPLPLYK